MKESKLFKYVTVDAYYSFLDNKLHYIIKKINKENGKTVKIADTIDNPKINIKLAPFTKKINYLLPSADLEEMQLPYREYFFIRKKIGNLYEGIKSDNKKSNKKYAELLSLEKEIYNDFKLETQFLQGPDFHYDDDYADFIDWAIWDIEVFHDDTEFTDPKETKYPINAITNYEKDGSVIIFILKDARHKDTNETIIDKILEKLNKELGEYKYKVNIYDTEADLIKNYLIYIKKYDVLVGWNSIDFDTQYIFNRSKKLGLEHFFTSSFGEMFEVLNLVDSKAGMTTTTFYTTKILTLDYIHLIKFFDKTNYPSYSINNIASKVLTDDDGINAKIAVPNLNVEYIKDLPNFILYNVNDVILNKKIDDKYLFVILLFNMKRMTRGFTASSMSVNNILDAYISVQCKNEGLAVISAIKTSTYYGNKIWNMYRRLNALSDSKLKTITELREDNKGYSLFVEQDDYEKYHIELNEDDLINTKGRDLNKKDIPFIYDKFRYPGAYVKVPRKGVYTNVVDFDASSMYPTAIYTTNCSCDTWVYQIPENLALKFIYEREELPRFLEKYKFEFEIYDVQNDSYIRMGSDKMLGMFDNILKKELIITETGAIFIPAHLKEGFFRKLIKYPISERQSVKKEMKKLTKELGLTSDDPMIKNLNTNQLVLKIIANSVYGYLGFRRSRLVNVIFATTITISMQCLIRLVALQCQDVIDETTAKFKMK